MNAPRNAENKLLDGDKTMWMLAAVVALGAVMGAIRLSNTMEKDYLPVLVNLQRSPEKNNIAIWDWDYSGKFSFDEQVEAFVMLFEPVIIRNAPFAKMKAMRDWQSEEYILEKVPELYGVRRKEAEVEDKFTFVNEDLSEMALKALESGVGVETSEEFFNLSTSEFFDGLKQGLPQYFSLELGSKDLRPLERDLVDVETGDIATNPFSIFNRLEAVYLWIATKGVKARMHYDTAHNVNGQIKGKKRFWIVPPKAWAHARLHPMFSISQRQSQIDISDLPSELRVDVVLNPGEMLFIPAYFLHAVENVEQSVNLNFFSGAELRDLQKQLMKTSSVHPQVLDQVARSDPKLFPSYLAQFVIGFVLALKNNPCRFRPRKNQADPPPAFTIQDAKELLNIGVDSRFGLQLDIHNCDDWELNKCPPMHFEASDAAKTQFSMNYKRSLSSTEKMGKCYQLDQVLDIFLVDWWEAAVAAAVGFEKTCIFLRCLIASEIKL